VFPLSLPVRSEPLLAVLPECHALGAQDAVSLIDLAWLPLLLGPRSTNPGMHDQLLELCRLSGIEPRLGPPLENLQEALATISAGKAWTLLTATNAPRRTRGLAVRTLGGAFAPATVALAWRATGPGPHARTFIDLAIRARDQGELAPPVDEA
jgi:hypothetical protein